MNDNNDDNFDDGCGDKMLIEKNVLSSFHEQELGETEKHLHYDTMKEQNDKSNHDNNNNNNDDNDDDLDDFNMNVKPLSQPGNGLKGKKGVNLLDIPYPSLYTEQIIEAFLFQSLNQANVRDAGMAAVQKIAAGRSPWRFLFTYMSENVGPIAWPNIAYTMLKFYRSWHQDVTSAARNEQKKLEISHVNQGTKLKPSANVRMSLGYQNEVPMSMLVTVICYMCNIPKSRIMYNAAASAYFMTPETVNEILEMTPPLNSKFAALLEWTNSPLPPQSGKVLNFASVCDNLIRCVLAASADIAKKKSVCISENDKKQTAADIQKHIFEKKNEFVLAALYFTHIFHIANTLEQQRIKSVATRPDWVGKRLEFATQMDPDISLNLFNRLNGKGVGLYQEPIVWMFGVLLICCRKNSKAYLNVLALLEIVAQELIPKHTALMHAVMIVMYQDVLDFDNCQLNDTCPYSADILSQYKNEILEYSRELFIATKNSDDMRTKEGMLRMAKLRVLNIGERYMDFNTIRGQVNGRSTKPQLENYAIKHGLPLEAWDDAEIAKSHGPPVDYKTCYQMCDLCLVENMLSQDYSTVLPKEMTRMEHYLFVACALKYAKCHDPYLQHIATRYIHEEIKGYSEPVTLMKLARTSWSVWLDMYGRDVVVPISHDLSSTTNNHTQKRKRAVKKSSPSQSIGNDSNNDDDDDDDNNSDDESGRHDANKVAKKMKTSQTNAMVTKIDKVVYEPEKSRKVGSKMNAKNDEDSGPGPNKRNDIPLALQRKRPQNAKNPVAVSTTNTNANQSNSARVVSKSLNVVKNRSGKPSLKKNDNNNNDDDDEDGTQIIDNNNNNAERSKSRPVSKKNPPKTSREGSGNSNSKKKPTQQADNQNVTKKKEKALVSASKQPTDAPEKPASNIARKGESTKKAGASSVPQKNVESIDTFVQKHCKFVTVQTMSPEENSDMDNCDTNVFFKAPYKCCEEICRVHNNDMFVWGPFDNTNMQSCTKFKHMLGMICIIAKLCGNKSIKKDIVLFSATESSTESSAAHSLLMKRYLGLRVDTSMLQEWLVKTKPYSFTLEDAGMFGKGSDDSDKDASSSKVKGGAVDKFNMDTIFMIGAISMSKEYFYATNALYFLYNIPNAHRFIVPIDKEGQCFMSFYVPSSLVQNTPDAVAELDPKFTDMICTENENLQFVKEAMKRTGMLLKENLETHKKEYAAFGIAAGLPTSEVLKARVKTIHSFVQSMTMKQELETPS